MIRLPAIAELSIDDAGEALSVKVVCPLYSIYVLEWVCGVTDPESVVVSE